MSGQARAHAGLRHPVVSSGWGLGASATPRPGPLAGLRAGAAREARPGRALSSGGPGSVGHPPRTVHASASVRAPTLTRGALLPVCFVSSALRREVDGLTQEQAEARKQSEKDRAVLLSQMTVLEAELEEQQAQQEASAQQAEELRALRQQLAALDKQLRGQRHFMDVSVLDALDGRPRRSPPQRALPGHGVRARAQPRCCGPFASPCVARGLSPRARAGCGGPSAAHLAGPACPALPRSGPSHLPSVAVVLSVSLLLVLFI